MAHRRRTQRNATQRDARAAAYRRFRVALAPQPGLGVFFETKPRRIEMALYCAPKALEALYAQLPFRKDLEAIPWNGEVAMCCASTAMFSYVLETNPSAIKTPIRKGLQWLWS